MKLSGVKLSLDESSYVPSTITLISIYTYWNAIIKYNFTDIRKKFNF